MKFTMTSASGVPVGAYVAEFSTVEDHESTVGPGLKWSFRIVAGPHVDAITSCITDCKPTTKNKLGRLLNGLAGKTLGDGESINIDTYIGRRYTIIVSAPEGKGSRVETVAPVPVA